MNVRTFHVRSMHDAIREIKDTLGPDAVILSTKRVRSWGNGFGLLGGTMLEVVAASDEEALAADLSMAEAEATEVGSGLRSDAGSAAQKTNFEQTLHGAMTESVAPRQPRPTPPASGQVRKTQEVPARSAVLKPLGRGVDTFERVYEDLLSHGVEAGTADQCLRELQSTLVEPGQTGRTSSLQLLRTVLLSRISTVGPLLSAGGEQKVALFVGPSGVGKTSTIAKLATHYGLVEQRSVGLITMDTFRPAAVEQLRLYAEVLGIELSVAGTAEQVRAAIEEHREAELILIDTPGFVPYQSLADQRWRGVIGLGYPLEIHLVMSAGTRVPDLVAMASNCIDLPALRLLFTKLDETRGYGGIFETTHRTGLPLSYWGIGQRVPDDLVQAHVDRLGDLLLGGSLRAPGMIGLGQGEGQPDAGLVFGSKGR